ncbi:MAG: phage major capsid protein [Kiritimatiellae bacterium]|nr:phage major capsid protein [Kiritimatiellia bacterium]
MALTFTELQAVTDVYWTDKKATDLIFQGNILLYKLMGGEMGSKLVSGGKTLDVPLEYGEVPSQSFNASTTFNTSKADIVNKAQFNWSAYQATVVYDLDDNRSNSGEAAIVDIIETKLRNAQKTLRKKMANALYGTGAVAGKDMTGLGDLFSDGTSAYGGILTADMTPWIAGRDATAEAITFAVMQGIRRAASIDDDATGKPNLYITTELLKDKFEASLHQQSRYSNAKLVEAGFDNILFGGVPVVADNKVPTGTCYGLNLEYLDILTHKDYNFAKPTWDNALATPETQVAYLKWSGNLICKNRGAQAVHTALT